MKNSTIDQLNRRMIERYGSTLSGLPHFRIVWSSDEFETRVGNYNDFHGRIFLRSYFGARRVPKYNYAPDRWILEMWKLINPPRELLDYNFYEPVYIFEDKDHNPLPPIWPVCERLCHAILNPVLDTVQVKQYIEDMMRKKYEREESEIYDSLDITKMQSQFHFKEAVILGG